MIGKMVATNTFECSRRFSGYCARATSQQSDRSPYRIGKDFELAAMDFLRLRFGMNLLHRGGPGDEGVDMIGRWSACGKELVVIVQCKAFRKPLSPSNVRELEGALHGFSPSRFPPIFEAAGRDIDTPHLGVLVAAHGFTEKARAHCRSSHWPLLLVHLRQGQCGTGNAGGAGNAASTGSSGSSGNTGNTGIHRSNLIANARAELLIPSIFWSSVQ
ncbi:hypothetical protein M427DRAFT_193070 [Gonapodya prolifera JEL478]|uniref:Uncharacterized protein n=1 Tax=Gonapodya prolifera (strain JEL478) TaxID=1344416 RepID=A0A139A0V9_GONPJ|nr:hypothetical protein M427DRAFT_193070 [Gonapodya prolifera JEL478]|eukprot:KXS09993.1 hypothetical protein M427DRAFT_193070 [Gonapodya prolifera JEL478]